jgi:(1->4)-alpha-D-glucan 1-alpha-D-glucosylmutase
MTRPRATLRLQFHKEFTFDDAVRLVPYLAALHVSHLYASPIMTARAGSRHGYDVIDPTRVNPELGGEDGFRRLVGTLRQAGLGIIVDIVPNHMAVGGADNAWWLDLLQHGRESRFAAFFDVDWEAEDPALRGKILAPFLGCPYGEVLESGEITIDRDGPADRHVVRYHDHVFPIAPGTMAEIDGSPPAAFDPRMPEVRARLHRLLERQHFRLAWWRTANDEINWRRFFDINDLAALRMEDETAFETTHATLFRLYGEGLIDGVRVDHVDGLSDPGGYCRRLRSRFEALAQHRPPGSGPPYLVVEKILGAGEQCPADWLCDGTSGYDFMNDISAVLHDPAGETPLGELWTSVSGRPGQFSVEEEASRREVLDRSFTAQCEAAAAALHRLARAVLATRDVSRAAIRRSLRDILASMRMYRTYASPEHRSEADRGHLMQAVRRAREVGLRADRSVLDLIASWLGGEPVATAEARALQAAAMQKFQQLSAPLAAKAVEDTAFYRYGRLLSRVDVGFDAATFADGIPTFHRKTRARRERFPGAMLATATHDHKRGEDVRGRLAVLSEIAAEWSEALERWLPRSAPLCGTIDGEPVPSRADAAILFQMIVGAWPCDLAASDRDGRSGFARRLAGWQEKALREAKLATDWTAPNAPYETAARQFVEQLFDQPATGLITELAAFAHRIAPAGAVNGLSQTLIKLTAPGVPDIYQGTDFWDFSLVDPDNRRPVDFRARMDALTSTTSLAELASSWRDGRIKQRMIARALALRRALPALFAAGDYVPLAADGPAADHVIAFARRHRDMTAVTVAARLVAHMLEPSDRITIGKVTWSGTTLRLPEDMVNADLCDAIRYSEPVRRGRQIAIADILCEVPFALLVDRHL